MSTFLCREAVFTLVTLILLTHASGSLLQVDTIATATGSVKITFINHASLMFEWKGKIIHIDPFEKNDVYASLPKADLILITHEHHDHFGLPVCKKLSKQETVIAASPACVKELGKAVNLKNGDRDTLCGIPIEVVPAYNIVNKRPDGSRFHPKGSGNGYVLTFDNIRVYIAGDTENIPEMKQLKNITVAFLPMNLPYTMSPEMTADAARMIMPKIMYPYHYGKTDTRHIVNLLKGSGIDVRIRKM
jgi:L-ascorbate metabolism protein UlaG (beta-lactamase superfamily)